MHPASATAYQHVYNPNIGQTPSPQESLQKLIEDIKSLSQELVDKIKDITDKPHPVVIEAVHLVKHTLTAAIASTQGSWALPNKENLSPNQRTYSG